MTELHNQYQNWIFRYVYVYLEYMNILGNHKHWNWDKINKFPFFFGIREVVIIKNSLRMGYNIDLARIYK